MLEFLGPAFTSRTFFFGKNRRVGPAKGPSSPECLVEHLAKVAFEMMDSICSRISQRRWLEFLVATGFFRHGFLSPEPAEFRPGFATPDGKAAPVPSKVEGWNAAWVEPGSKWGSHEPSTNLDKAGDLSNSGLNQPAISKELNTKGDGSPNTKRRGLNQQQKGSSLAASPAEFCCVCRHLAHRREVTSGGMMRHFQCQC